MKAPAVPLFVESILALIGFVFLSGLLSSTLLSPQAKFSTTSNRPVLASNKITAPSTQR